MELRWYQAEAVEAVYNHLRTKDTNPCIVIPTGGGKTPILARISHDAVVAWGGRVCLVADRKELLTQTTETLRRLDPDLDIGVFSASLKSKVTKAKITVAQIQSIYNKAYRFDPWDLIIVDECFVAGTLISTPTGDIPIEELRPGKSVNHAFGVGEVLCTSARNAYTTIEIETEDGSRIQCTEDHPVFTASGWKRAKDLVVGEGIAGVEAVRLLQEANEAKVVCGTGRKDMAPAGPLNVAKEGVLLRILCEEAEESCTFAWGERPDAGNNEGERQKGCSQRGERPPTATVSGQAAGDPWFMLEGRVGNSHENQEGEWIPDLLQGRSWKRVRNDCTGDRRRIAPDAGQASAGHEEELPAGFKRVASITHHEGKGGRVVYNLHVKGHPSYYANGILVHNCHMIPPKGEGRYREFLQTAKLMNPRVRLIGLTATPYRLGCGMICAPDHLLNEVCYEVGVKELIAQGYLSKMISREGGKCDTSKLHIKQGEFVESELEDMMMEKVEAACHDLVARTTDRKAVLVFCVSVAHADAVAGCLERIQDQRVEVVTGKSLLEDRDCYVGDFKAGRIKYLVNVNIFTTGFDAPNVDGVALLRPTLSPGLYYQSVGRGFRICEGKSDCLVLDYSGNIDRHGPIDQIRPPKEPGEKKGEAPQKVCPKCALYVHAAATECPDCGFEFPPKEFAKHETAPADRDIVSGQSEPPEPKEFEMEVTGVRYSQHFKRGAEPGTPSTLKVTYDCGLVHSWQEWICLDHEKGSFAWGKAQDWLEKRWRKGPLTVLQAVEVGNKGGFRTPAKVKVTIGAKDKKFPRVEGLEFQAAKDPFVEAPATAVPEDDGFELPLAIRTLLVDHNRDDVDAICCVEFGCHLEDLAEDQFDELARKVEYMRNPALEDLPF